MSIIKPAAKGGFLVLVRHADDSRHWHHLDVGTEEQARNAYERVKAKIREERKTIRTTQQRAKGKGPTFREWVETVWNPSRKAKGLASANRDLSKLGTHVLPFVLSSGRMLGEVRIDAITRDDLEELVTSLDAKTRRARHEGGISWKTAANIWGVVSKAFTDAHKSKLKSVRVRSDDPSAAVEGPDRGIRKAKAFLYPSEFVALMECDAVPVRWKQLVALSVYLYARAGEIAALRPSDIDLAHGVVSIHSAIDRFDEKGKRKETKSNLTRIVPIESTLTPLMRELVDSASPERLVAMPPATDMSSTLRRYLEAAGVRRAGLLEGDATRKQITWHDLRATGITWLAVRGDDPVKIMRRAGHEQISTTMAYVRTAESLSPSFGEVFPPLLQGWIKSGSSNVVKGNTRSNVASPGGFEPPPKTKRQDPKHACSKADSNYSRYIDDPTFDPFATREPSRVRKDNGDGKLIEAIAKASAAGRWDIVAELAGILKKKQA